MSQTFLGLEHELVTPLTFHTSRSWPLVCPSLAIPRSIFDGAVASPPRTGVRTLEFMVASP
jgi:hypothetical protein